MASQNGQAFWGLLLPAIFRPGWAQLLQCNAVVVLAMGPRSFFESLRAAQWCQYSMTRGAQGQGRQA